MFGLSKKEKTEKLFKAFKENNTEKIINLISKGADVNAKDEYGKTPLYIALDYHFKKDIAELLILKGADVNSRGHEGSVLLLALKGGYKEISNLLLSKGAEINEDKLLYFAVEMGSLEIVELLISKGADVNSNLPLHSASDKCFSENPRQLKRTYKSSKPLFWNLESKKIFLDIAKLLISKGAKVNSVGRTPLLIASTNGFTEMAELLISKGADVNPMDDGWGTPLGWAVEKGFKETAELLISKGADVNKNNFLFGAAKKGLTDIVELLISHGANVNAKYMVNDFEDTILYSPSCWGFIEIVKLLISNGADVNAKTSSGTTALHGASLNGHNEIVELLISKGADVNAMENDGATPLHWALKKGFKETAELLISKGADTTYHEKVGWIVWMEVTFTSTPGLDKALMEANSKRDEIITGGHIWTVYNNEQTAKKIGQLLINAGIKDPGVKKVKCYSYKNAPQIDWKKARTMENGWIIENCE